MDHYYLVAFRKICKPKYIENAFWEGLGLLHSVNESLELAGWITWCFDHFSCQFQCIGLLVCNYLQCQNSGKGSFGSYVAYDSIGSKATFICNPVHWYLYYLKDNTIFPRCDSQNENAFNQTFYLVGYSKWCQPTREPSSSMNWSPKPLTRLPLLLLRKSFWLIPFRWG